MFATLKKKFHITNGLTREACYFSCFVLKILTQEKDRQQASPKIEQKRERLSSGVGKGMTFSRSFPKKQKKKRNKIIKEQTNSKRTKTEGD